jgi:hypothetical protein
MHAYLLLIEQGNIVMRNVSSQFCLSILMPLQGIHELLFFLQLVGALIELGQPRQSLSI